MLLGIGGYATGLLYIANWNMFCDSADSIDECHVYSRSSSLALVVASLPIIMHTCHHRYTQLRLMSLTWTSPCLFPPIYLSLPLVLNLGDYCFCLCVIISAKKETSSYCHMHLFSANLTYVHTSIYSTKFNN